MGERSILWICLWALGFGWGQVAVAQQSFKFKHISTSEGLSQSTVRAIFRDSRGFLWLGTEDGLNRYDGLSFDTYLFDADDSTSLSSNYIQTLIEDENGDLWIPTNYGLNRLAVREERFYRYFHRPQSKNSLWNNVVYSIAADTLHNIWIGTYAGLNRFDLRSKQMHRVEGVALIDPNKGYDAIYSIYVDTDQSLWLATDESGLEHYHPATGQRTVYKHLPGDTTSLLDNQVVRLRRGNDGLLYVLSAAGLSVFDGATFRNYPIASDGAAASGGMQASLPIDFEIDAQGQLWIGYNDKGVDRFDPRTRRFYNYQHQPMDPASLPGNSIRDIYCEANGMVWVGTFAEGVSVASLQTPRFLHYPPQPGQPNALSNKNVWAFAQDSGGRVWIGTDNGIDLFHPTKGDFGRIGTKPQTDELANKKVWSLCAANPNEVWVATLNGIERVRCSDLAIEHVQHLPADTNSLPENHVRMITRTRSGDLLLATWGAGVCRYEVATGRFVRYPYTADEHNHRFIWGVLEGSDGKIYTSSYRDGLGCLDPQTGRYTFYTHQPGTPGSIAGDRLAAIFEDSRQRLWVAVRGSGLDLFDRKTQQFRHFGTKEGLPNNVVYAIAEDKQGHLWLTTNKGMAKFDPDSERFWHYTTEDGLQDMEFNGGAAMRSPSGQMWVGGINGFNSFWPDSVRPDSTHAPIYITQLKVLNRTVRPGQEVGGRVLLKQSILFTPHIELRHTDKVFSLQFACLDYSNASKIRYQYKLHGFDKDWNIASPGQRVATYSNLNPGTYQFEVVAANKDGVWAQQGAQLHIVVVPPVWATWWFRALLVGLVVAASYAYYRNKLGQERRDKLRLEQLVQQRTTDLQATNERLRKEREHTLSSIQYAKTIQQAMLPSPERLRKLFANQVIYWPKDIVSGDFYWTSRFVDQDNEIVFLAVADCTGHGVPGAFMSTISHRILNLVINERRIFEPHLALEEIDAELFRALNQDASANNDGLDIALCRIDTQAQRVQAIHFAGAKIPLFVLERGIIRKIEATRRSIGGRKRSPKPKPFEAHTWQPTADSRLYLCTDGIIDQHAANRKRLGTPAFMELLQRSAALALDEQFAYLIENLLQFQQNEPQRDDITLVGIQI